MKQHIVPTVIATVISCVAALGVVRYGPTKPPVVVQTSQAGSISPARAARLAKTVWPELSQDQVNLISADLRGAAKVPVTIVCIEDAKCGDMALNLDNAFESERWETSMVNSTMVPAGVWTSSKFLLDVLNQVAPELGAKLDTAPNAGPGDYIAIGARP